MEIIARDWNLPREVPALDVEMITTGKMDFDRRNVSSGESPVDAMDFTWG